MFLFQDDLGSPLMCKDPNNVWYIQGNVFKLKKSEVFDSLYFSPPLFVVPSSIQINRVCLCLLFSYFIISVRVIFSLYLLSKMQLKCSTWKLSFEAHLIFTHTVHLFDASIVHCEYREKGHKIVWYTFKDLTWFPSFFYKRDLLYG